MVLRGRTLNILDMENRSRVCLIDETLARELFPEQILWTRPCGSAGIPYRRRILAENGDSSVMNAQNQMITEKRHSLRYGDESGGNGNN
jgi:hypothetical protein